ncbi:MAG: hypothetical protein V4510_12830 [bacterium]
MRKPRPFLRRLFLNERGQQSSAHIISSISTASDSWTPKGGEPTFSRNIGAGFRIGDCTRMVDLEFDAWVDTNDGPSPQLWNARLKAIRLRREVNDFVAKYLEAIDWALEVEEDK